MCRNIRTLHNFEPPATTEEIDAAALQFVRKICGTSRPSRANEQAFNEAREEVSRAVSKLLSALVSNAPPKNREVEKAKAQARSRKRFGQASAR